MSSETATNANNVRSESDSDNGLCIEPERTYHPLTNDVVLRTLFGYVKPNDLKSFRLVCKKWTILTLHLARSAYRVTVLRDDSEESRVTDFVALFGSNNCFGIPFAEFKIGSFDLKLGAGQQFIQFCGEMAKKLDLSGTPVFHSVGNVAELLRSTPNLECFKMSGGLRQLELQSSDFSPSTKLFPEPCELPSLKYLKTLDFGEGGADEYMKVCPTFFEELLSAAENISTLFSSDARDANVGLELLKTVEKLGRESKLETLSLLRVNTDIVEVTQKMFEKPQGLKLKHLKIKYGSVSSVYPRRTDLPWVALVELMKESLVSLHIDCNYCLPPKFPRMPKLEHLYLGSHPNRLLQVKFQNFKDTFPALQCLKLQSRYHLCFDEFFIGTEQCPLMETLNLGKCFVTLRPFANALDILPNLKELELKITVDPANILQKIWSEMTRLEKLNIFVRLSSGFNIESLVTGISSQEIRKIRKKFKLSTVKDMTMEVRRQTILELIQEHRTLPSIGNLTNLRHLTLNMTGRAGKHKPFLSDLTGYFGFYTLKNLRYLNITDCKLSKTCSQILVDEMELDSWNFQRPGKTHIIPARWNSGNDGGDLIFPNSKFSFDSTI